MRRIDSQGVGIERVGAGFGKLRLEPAPTCVKDLMDSPALDLSLYAGRWIAIVHGRIVASGKTAHETWMHCRAERIKDEPILRYVPPAAKQLKHKSE